MIEQTRTKLIQELNQLKIELDRSNKFKDEMTMLKFTLVSDQGGRLKLFATTGSTQKLLLEKRDNILWRTVDSNQYSELGNWLCNLLKYESNSDHLISKIQLTITSLYCY